ncbi:MAG: MATE family efflux transporter [Candidatus Goldbacteria bacterium]|nr:MATE family efflux transporter [Candidatus Goldiibacteriota bacterium]
MSKLTKKNVLITIIKMAVPMLAGTFAINANNLINAWFVSRLGTESLAAISFAIPVVMLISFVVRGIGTGTMTLVAHALGEKNTDKTTGFIIHSILLSVFTAILITIPGILSIKFVFTKFGAKDNVLNLVSDYMKIWYLGSTVMILQMILSDVILGTGHTKAISFLMVFGTVINIFFDYSLIFGNFGMPALGIRGAACATIISQLFGLIGAFIILKYKLKLIDSFAFKITEIFNSWLQILKFAIPGALGMIMTPVSAGIITRLVANYGNEAVAALGVANRIEMFAFMIPMTVGISLMPFIAQNYGAKRIDRVMEARKLTMIFAGVYGVIIAILFFIFSRPMAGVFSNDTKVVDILVKYICITCFGYGMLEIHRYSGFCLTGLHLPIQASVLDIIRMIILLVPLSIIGDKIFQLNGIFMGRLGTDILAGLIGIFWSAKAINKKLKINF